MFNLPNNNNWENNVQAYSTTDPVLGGVGGDSNDPIQQLTNRTTYLFDRLGRFENINSITGDTLVDVSAKNRFNNIDAPGNIIVTIDDVASFEPGTVLPFKCKCPSARAVSLQTTGGQLLVDGNIATTQIFMCDGEDLSLLAAGTFWLVRYGKGNWGNVGNDDLKRIQPRNTLVADGCKPEIGGALYLRANYPRLWAAVSGSAISDSIWQSDPFTFRCFFSDGDGVSTFRVPDMRALFRRGLDLGRGVRIGQLNNTPGSFEMDGFKDHSHSQKVFTATNNGGRKPVGFRDTANDFGDSGYNTGSTGGSETMPKNGGFIPIIYY